LVEEVALAIVTRPTP